jgi:biopolymer transport protein ExbB
MSVFLLQAGAAVTSVATDTAAAHANAVANATPGLSLIDLILRGGWIMLPIFLLLIVDLHHRRALPHHSQRRG